MPQLLNARGKVPRGEACLGLAAEVMRDGATGLVVGLAFRRYVAERRADSREYADVVGVLPPGRPEDLYLAVAWGAGPYGIDIGDLDGRYQRTWIPADGTVCTHTWAG